MKDILISQKENYKNNFGVVLRSSGIFYFKKNEKFKTTISFLNYWLLRQTVSVLPIANIRTLDGELVRREILNFKGGSVINYSPEFSQPFEGSVEVEIFSLDNLRIPYAAIMAVYETDTSVSMVHGYARIYSQHEIEEKRTIASGREACIPVFKNYVAEVVFHNGNEALGSQEGKLKVKFRNGKEIEKQVSLPGMCPFETRIINISKYIEWADSESDIAEGYFNFELKNAFTRLFCINRKEDDSDYQVTHSDFNYQIHKTDDIKKNWAIVTIPKRINEHESFNLIAWGANEPLSATIKSGEESHRFSGTQFTRIRSNPGAVIEFVAEESNNLPSRIHTAIQINPSRNHIPAVCNLGVYHAERPPKKMWWALIGHEKYKSTGLSINSLEKIYGSPGGEAVNIRLYSSHSIDYCSVDLNVNNLLERGQSIELGELFPNYKEFLSNDFGYITLYSDYPGLLVFSYISTESGSITIEHGF